MGNAGSYTTKASISPGLFTFTRWTSGEMADFLNRGLLELSETFGLRKFEFEFLLGRDLVDFTTTRLLFNDVFDTDKNEMVDKFEVMCVICLTSKISNLEKIHFFFDLFNFNNKGFLLESELALMILSITRGVYKIDQKYPPPSLTEVKRIVRTDVLPYGKDGDQTSLRKPELVKYVMDNPPVLAFIESWRGIASQVLVNNQEKEIVRKWKDYSFPAAESSVIPTRTWLKYGLPPADFVKWRRRNKVGTSGVGCIYLFTHSVGFLKTVDRRPTYKGDGVVGDGYLKQGMLADRWFLNAVAAVIARPEMVTAFFAPTGQEDDVGRFCTRFFEGGAWRSVYVDDRLPCGPTLNPLFASSGNPLEAWPMLLEKGLAKYLGSYGHIAQSSLRPDATLFALRVLTGGHVLRLATNDFEWHSVDEEVIGESALKYINARLQEGSLISLGRSEPKAYMRQELPPVHGRKNSLLGNTKHLSDSSPLIPPVGKLFPVVGTVSIEGHVHLVLRDAWNIIEDSSKEVNFESGHSRTFLVKIEHVPYLYDMVVCVRFPDSFHSISKAKIGKTWFTEVRSQATGGVRHPAHFQLTLLKKGRKHRHSMEGVDDPSEIFAQPIQVAGVVYKKPDVEVVRNTLKQVDEIGLSNLDPSAYLKKDPVNFSRYGRRDSVRDAMMLASSRKPSLQDNLAALTNSMVDIVFTVSSSLDWKVAGSKEAGAKIRIKIVPSESTRMDWLIFDRLVAAEKKAMEQRIAKRKSDALRMMEIPNDTSYNPNRRGSAVSAQSNAGGSKQRGQRKSRVSISSHSKIDGTSGGGTRTSSDQVSEEAGGLDGQSASARRSMLFNGASNPTSPITINRKRFASMGTEGDLTGIADDDLSRGDDTSTSTAQSPQVFGAGAAAAGAVFEMTGMEGYDRRRAELLQSAMQGSDTRGPKEIDIELSAERSWLSHSVQLLPGVYYMFADVSFDIPYAEAFQMALPLDLAEAPWLDGQSPHNEEARDIVSRHTKTFSRKSSRRATDAGAGAGGTRSAGKSGRKAVAAVGKAKDLLHLLDDNDLSKQPKIWIQVSSTTKFDLKSSTAEEPLVVPRGVDASLKEVQVDVEKWPFMGESQAETASRELIKQLTQLKKEAGAVGIEFMTLANKYKEEKRKALMLGTRANS